MEVRSSSSIKLYWARMGKKSLKDVQDYDINRSAETIEKIYQSLKNERILHWR